MVNGKKRCSARERGFWGGSKLQGKEGSGFGIWLMARRGVPLGTGNRGGEYLAKDFVNVSLAFERFFNLWVLS